MPDRIPNKFCVLNSGLFLLLQWSRFSQPPFLTGSFRSRCLLSRHFLDRFRRLDYTNFFDSGRGRGLRGALVAETHLSTQSAPPSQDPRVPRAHEEQRRAQSAGGAPQEGTSSPHANLVPRGSRPGAREPRTAFLARCGCYGARSSKRYIAAGGGARACNSRPSRGPMASRTAGWESA